VSAEARRNAAVRARLGLALDAGFADLSALEALEGQPVLIVANHVCALDAAVAMRVADATGRKLLLAAAPVVLERHPVLRRFGVFTVSRGTPLETTRELRAVGRWLNGTPDGMVVFFPQGGHVRLGCPTTCERGALVVAHAAPRARLVPLALHYELFTDTRPIAWARSDAPAPAVRGASLDDLLAGASAALADDLTLGRGAYRPLVGRRGRTVLLRNVPCQRKRLEQAALKAGLPASAVHDPATVDRFVTAIARQEGPFYARLVRDSLTST
jgi:hypothetical protein